MLTPSRVTTTMNLVELTQLAFELPFSGVVDGRDWARSERLDVVAAMPATRLEGDLPIWRAIF